MDRTTKRNIRLLFHFSAETRLTVELALRDNPTVARGEGDEIVREWYLYRNSLSMSPNTHMLPRQIHPLLYTYRYTHSDILTCKRIHTCGTLAYTPKHTFLNSHQTHQVALRISVLM